MKKYYLHNGVESSGPFSLAELEEKKITATTPVWFSGIPDWKTAGEIAELQIILKVTPPPFKNDSVTPKNKEKNNKIMGLSKSSFYLVAVLILLVIGSFVLNFIGENRKLELEERNNKTEKENRQFQLQEEEIKAQKEHIAEQERLEKERISKEKKEIIAKRLAEIQIEFPERQTLLNEAKNELNKANQFHFFRTEEEKSKEINAIQTKITYLSNELKLLENERNQLNLELERLQLNF